MPETDPEKFVRWWGIHFEHSVEYVRILSTDFLVRIVCDYDGLKHSQYRIIRAELDRRKAVAMKDDPT